MLRIGQNCRAVYTNMVVMEMYSRARDANCLALVGHQASHKATGRVIVLSHTSFNSLVISMFKWSENITISRRPLVRATILSMV